MNITETRTPDAGQKEALLELWNAEYPAQLVFTGPEGLETYLDSLRDELHLFVYDTERLLGWAVLFEREGENWFAVIVAGEGQRKGLGSLLLSRLKEKKNPLNGWVIDHARDRKLNGEAYISPLEFYTKNGFRVLADKRLELDTISAVRITWP